MELFLIAALLLRFVSSEVLASDCPPGTFNDGSTCCNLCPAGTFLVTACYNGTASECKTCPINTFNPSTTRQKSCQKCKTRCPVSQLVSSPCLPTRDLQCHCKAGKYFDTGLLYCMQCRVCGQGFGAWRACSTDSNTDCRPCPAGTFSDSVTNSEPCKPCKVCGSSYAVGLPCTAYNNTRCIKMANTSTVPTTGSLPVPSRSTSYVNTRPNVGSEWMVPTTIVVVLALLVVLVIALFMYYRRTIQCRRGSIEDDTEITDQGESAIPLNPCEEQTSHPMSRGFQHVGLRGRHKAAPRRGNRDSASDSQGSTGSLQGGKGTLVRDLPADVIEAIALLLNPTSKNDWTRLASQLGYTSLQIANWRLMPVESTQRLLQDWQTRDTSTADKLYKTLSSIHRDDAAGKLKNYR